MRHILMAGLITLLAVACASSPENTAPAGEASTPKPGPGFDRWGTGKGLYTYHRLAGTCQTLTHAHGRNAVNGLWKMPLAGVTAGGVEQAEQGPAIVRFTCKDGGACIAKGYLDATPDTVPEHTIPFETMDLARAYTAEIAALKSACGLSS
jgi:hypothetical protein